MRASRLPAVVALALALVACQSGGGGAATEGGVRSDGFPAPSRYAIYDTAQRVLREQQMAVDTDASSMEGGVVVSRWRASLSPFSREGFREKATVRIVPVAGRTGYWRTETNVVRQINADTRQPDNAMAADWTEDARNPQLEALINRRIEMFFLPSDVSPVFRRQHGMGESDSPRIEDLPQPDDAASDDPFDFLTPR